jgi:hypothetical protein
MASVPLVVFPEGELFRALTYTGDNSADLNSLIEDFTITSETATTLSFTSAGTAYSVPRNSYVVYREGVVTNTYLNEDDFMEAFGDVASATDHYHEVILKSGPAIAAGTEA